MIMQGLAGQVLELMEGGDLRKALSGPFREEMRWVSQWPTLGTGHCAGDILPASESCPAWRSQGGVLIISTLQTL